MTAPTHPTMELQRVACSICRKEIPLSSALTPEGAEYVGYFCGIECYKEFLSEQRAASRNRPDEEEPGGSSDPGKQRSSRD
jgi:Domain of unknown function (DUF3330)